MTESYLLSLLIFSPLLGILILLFIPKNQEKMIKLIGFLATVLPLALAFMAYSAFDKTASGYQFVESKEWINFSNGTMQAFGIDMAINYELGLNGLGMVLILLTAVVASLAAIASIHIKREWKGYFMLFLLLEIGMLGVFAAQNLFLFFLFFEITLIPMYFLIGKWGYIDREKAANSFLIYNGLGSAVMLIAFVALFVRTGTMNIEEITMMMQALGPEANNFKWGVLVALLIAFGVKLPIFPLHSWMLRVHVQAPPAIVMIHSGILLKIGAYGLIRFGLGFFPEQITQIAMLIAILGVINLLYGAYLALIQTDLKMVMAYSSISHMGIVLIGIAALNEAGIQGAVFQVVSHGLISALLFFLIGVYYERTKTSEIPKLGGLARSMPIASGFLLVGALASLGLPGMSGFISEFLAFLGLFREMPIVAAVGALGIILTAIYLLKAVLNVTYGPTPDKWHKLEDIRPLELVPVLVLVGFIVLIGVYPSILAEPLQVTLQLILQGIGG
ncbi:complex I subunit 4 family protein [Desertibacillus haloalkaliphilus]|uniref:complex I subunit 4 family protein n=1 Tax=Desertibacillus haloalkaliphilus TaxID=1328930 RepID=UPI001C27B691|nr:NADH-quinone oxidoreductase subunit M [Desertibacillus haloalkaliphilus]MBU8905901.1 NADH-quinone oxidoreductase subunit M [Desertibacillus haloalkaliphilus]